MNWNDSVMNWNDSVMNWNDSYLWKTPFCPVFIWVESVFKKNAL